MKPSILTLLGLSAGLLTAPALPSPGAAAPPPLSDKDKHQAVDESKQGAEVAAQITKEGKLSTDKDLIDRVNRIGQRIAAVANSTVVPAHYGNDRVYPFTWRFFVVKDKDVNAFSLPGGYVYVNTGLLNFIRSDDELAGVLAHEITHAAHHHVAALSHEQSRMSTKMALGMLAAVLAHVPVQDMANLYEGASYAQLGIMNNTYSEAAESDADHGGAILMAKAGFNPVGMLTFMQRLAEQEQRSPSIEMGILQDHPFTDERVGAIRTQLAEMKVSVTPQAVRQVTNGPRVSVAPGAGPSERLVFAGQTLATLLDPTGERATSAAQLLNTLLDSGLQLYQVKAESGVLVAADRRVLAFTPADAALQPGADVQALATDASAVLRKGLWAQTVNGNSPGY